MESNAKRGMYNVLFGALGQLATIIVGLLVPRFILVNLGSEQNGLLSSIQQILVYLALLEMGVGAATTQALYQPVGAGDRNGISGILCATDRYYKRTGLIYFLILLVIALGYPLVVEVGIPYLWVVLVVLFSGMPSVLAYFFQAKYKLLLKVEGKSYIITNISTITTVLISAAKIVLLNLGCNVVIVQLSYMLLSFLQVLYFAAYIHKHYKWLNLKSEPNEKAISQKGSALVHQVTALIFSNTDMLILTLFSGLNTVSVYSMYNMVFTMVKTAINTVNSSVYFSMGQAYANNKARFMRMHDLFEVCNMALTFALYSIAAIFVLPFLEIYTDGVHDIQYIQRWLPLAFIATFLLDDGRVSSLQVILYAGKFKETTRQAVIEAVINIVVSLAAVRFLGIYGVLAGTAAALLYRTNDMIIYTAKELLHRSPIITYRRWLRNLAVFVAVIILAGQVVPQHFTGYVPMVLWAAVVSLLVIPIFFLVSLLLEPGLVGILKEILVPYVRKMKKILKR